MYIKLYILICPFDYLYFRNFNLASFFDDMYIFRISIFVMGVLATVPPDNQAHVHKTFEI